MKITFVEDSVEDMNHIKKIVKNFHEILPSYYTSASEFYKAKEETDAIILGIDIPDENGLIIAKNLRKCGYDKPIAFISWYQGFEHESFDVQAFYFIRKEFMEIELEKCLKKLIEHDYKKNGVLIYQNDDGEVKIPAHSIRYIERVNNGVMLHFVTGPREQIRGMTLTKILEQQLFGFHQINKSIIVNFYHIKKYSKLDEILMKDDLILEISRRKGKSTMEAYRNFICRR